MTAVAYLMVESVMDTSVFVSTVMSKDDDILSGGSDFENKHPDGDGGSDSDYQHNTSGNRKKRKGRNHKGGKHHRKWKPYNKMTWSERKEMEDRETIRATMKREEAFASGHPVAPYNTTQFLIDDHIQGDVSHDLQRIGDNGKDGSFGSESSEDRCDSGDEDEIFLAKEFSATYDNIHAERLQTMSKEELIKDYLEMERKVESLERLSRDTCQPALKSGCRGDGSISIGDRDSSDGQSLSSSGEEPIDIASVKKIEEHIKSLKDENYLLKAEIGRLKKND